MDDSSISSMDRTRARHLIEDNAAHISRATPQLLLYMDLVSALLSSHDRVVAAMGERLPLSFFASALTLVCARFCTQRRGELACKHTSAAAFDAGAVAASVFSAALRLPAGTTASLARELAADAEFNADDMDSVIDMLQARCVCESSLKFKLLKGKGKGERERERERKELGWCIGWVNAWAE